MATLSELTLNPGLIALRESGEDFRKRHAHANGGRRNHSSAGHRGIEVVGMFLHGAIEAMKCGDLLSCRLTLRHLRLLALGRFPTGSNLRLILTPSPALALRRTLSVGR